MNFTLAAGSGFHGLEILSPEAIEDIKRWVGETVPLRGPNRELIGEATVTSVDVYGDDNIVHVSFESEIDPGLDGVKSVAKTVVGRRDLPAMSFGFLPQRGDDVERWLKARRGTNRNAWSMAIESLLDEYRERADYGLTLSDDEGLAELPEHG